MNIGLDFDGVVTNCGELKSLGIRKIYGINIPSKKAKKDIVTKEGYLTAEQYRNVQKIVYETREIGLWMNPVDGALYFLPKLIENGNTVVIITSRNGTGLEIAKEWSTLQGLKLEFVGVGDNSKANAAKGLDLYVDDDLHKLIPLIGIVPNLFLFSWGYNIGLDVGADIRRVASWTQLYRIIQRLRCIQ